MRAKIFSLWNRTTRLFVSLRFGAQLETRILGASDYADKKDLKKKKRQYFSRNYLCNDLGRGYYTHAAITRVDTVYSEAANASNCYSDDYIYSLGLLSRVSAAFGRRGMHKEASDRERAL